MVAYYKPPKLFSRKDYLVETLTVIRRESLKLSRKLCLGIQIFSCLQVLSIIFDPEEFNTLPWNYSSLDILWTTLGLTTRPYLILEQLSLSDLALFLIPLGCLLILMVYGLVFLHVRRRIKPAENITTVENKYIRLIKIESLLRYLLLDAGYLSVLLLHRYLFLRIIRGDSDQGYSVCLFILITVLYFPLIYSKGYYLMSLKLYTRAYNTMSHPQPYFYYKLVYMGLVYSTVKITSSRNPVEYSMVFMVSGAYLVTLFAYSQPYVRFIVNYIQCLKGVALFLAGLIMFMLNFWDSVDQTSYLATITFFAVMPFLSFLMKALMIRRKNYVLNNARIYSRPSECFIKVLERRYQNYAMIPDQEVFMTDVMRMRKMHRSNFYVHIWLMYYLLDAENLGGVCLFLSKIRRLTLTVQHRSFVQEFKEEFYKALQLNKEISEALDFISYRKKISLLYEQDKICCHRKRRIIEEFLGCRDINTLSKHMVKFLGVFKDAKEFYAHMIKEYQDSSELQESYAGFLKTLRNKEFVADATSKREHSREDKTLEENGYNLINSNALVLVVSLDKISLGYVLQVHNPDKFGYTCNQLEHGKCFFLFPNELRNHLKGILAQSMNYFNFHDLFIRTHSLYILSFSNYLRPVSVQFRIANTHHNQLCCVVTLESDKKGVEIALLSDDGRRIMHIVIST